jgi:hypothetical protein
LRSLEKSYFYSNTLNVYLPYYAKATLPDGTTKQVAIRETSEETIYQLSGEDWVRVRRLEKQQGETIDQALNRLYPPPPGLPNFDTLQNPSNPSSFLLILYGVDSAPDPFANLREDIRFAT